MHYAVFIPRGERTFSSPDDLLSSVGLGDLGSACVVAMPLSATGPDGLSGTLLYWGDPRQPPRDRAGWTWQPAPARSLHSDGLKAGQLDAALAAGRYWLGWNPDAPPVPAELRRSTFLGGLEVTLEDGNDWIIPTAKVLPRRMGLDPTGEITMQIAPPFRAFCEAAEDLLAHLAAADPNRGSLEIPGCWRVANAALGINYRLNAELVSMLGLFSDRSMVQVCLAVIELPLDIHYVDIEKKTALQATFTPAISAGSPGAMASAASCLPGGI